MHNNKQKIVLILFFRNSVRYCKHWVSVSFDRVFNPILHNLNYSTFLIMDYPVDDSLLKQYLVIVLICVTM